MSDGGRLFRAILEAPGDDLRRLVYADWLEENGQPERAEFVRLQCRIAALERDCRCGRCVRRRGGGQQHNGPCAVDREREELPGGRSRQASLCRREQGLLDDHWGEWVHAVFDPLAYDVGVATSGSGTRFKVSLYDRGAGEQGHMECDFRRGFVASVSLTLADFYGRAGEGCGPRLVLAAPLEEVRLADRRPSTWARAGYGDWYWVLQHGPTGHLPDRLPPALYEALPPGVRKDDDGVMTYASEGRAVGALSASCLAWARAAAGLP